MFEANTWDLLCDNPYTAFFGNDFDNIPKMNMNGIGGNALPMIYGGESSGNYAGGGFDKCCNKPAKTDDDSTVWHAALHTDGGADNVVAALRSAGEVVQTRGGTATVQLAAGRYQLRSSLKIPSGVSLLGATGSGTVLSGGIAITGWQPESLSGQPWLWRAVLPLVLRGPLSENDALHGWANSTRDNAVRQLWVDGQRRGVARTKLMRFVRSLGSGITAKPGQLRRTYNTTSLRAVTYQHWTAASRPVTGCPDDCNIHNLVCPEEDMPDCLNKTCPGPDVPCNQIHWTEPNYPYTGDGCGANPTYNANGPDGQNGRWYLQNSFDFLRPESGQFFADGVDIYYTPTAAERAAFVSGAASVYAARPGLRTLLHGGDARCLPHIGPEYTDDQIFHCGRNKSNSMRVQDLILEHTDSDELLCLHTTQKNIKDTNICTGQSASHIPSAAVHFNFAEHVELSNLTVRHTGAWGVWFGAGSRNCTLRHSTVTDTGAGSARIGEAGDGACVAAYAKFPEQKDYWCNTTRIVHNVTLADNTLTDGGHIWPEAAGVLMQVAHDSTVTHNQVSSFRYSGISVGWSWGYLPTATGANVISHNDIFSIGLGELCDLACVYHLGQDNGTQIVHNSCRNVSSYGYGGNAYYTDQGSSNINLSHNLAHDIKCSGWQENYGVNNSVTNK
jgi:hypothetical protein